MKSNLLKLLKMYWDRSPKNKIILVNTGVYVSAE